MKGHRFLHYGQDILEINVNPKPETYELTSGRCKQDYTGKDGRENKEELSTTYWLFVLGQLIPFFTFFSYTYFFLRSFLEIYKNLSL